jgi:hypothetical protein
MISDATSGSRVIVLSGLVLAVAAGAAALSTDFFLSRGFDKALETSRPGLSFDTAAAKAKTQAAAAGDEGYWLTRAEVQNSAPFTQAVAIGDRISIAGRDGRQRQLEVVDLKAIGGELARAANAAPLRLLLVTCRVTGEAADRAEAPVRFIIEAGPPPPALPAPAKAL